MRRLRELAGQSPIWLAGRKGRSGGTRSEAEMGPASIKKFDGGQQVTPNISMPVALTPTSTRSTPAPTPSLVEAAAFEPVPFEPVSSETVPFETVPFESQSFEPQSFEPQWERDGYVILRGVLEPSACDALGEVLGEAWRYGHPDQLVVDSTTGRSRKLEAGDARRLTRAVDTHVHYPEARELLANPVVTGKLRAIFGADPLYFQTLVFELGSEQGLHQDTSFVVVDDPMAMVGVWIALEDVQAGSGELRYVPGSHRLEPYEFAPGRRHFDSSIDPPALHEEYYPLITQRCVDFGLTEQRFLARKGDVLIWSADLVHGGSPIVDATLTRRSLVAHACPVTANPHFFSHFPGNRTLVPLAGDSGDSGRAFYASQYHVLDSTGQITG
jgi:phytanoyl-CoA hydroxylase